MTILGTSPEMVAPDLVIELEAITAMKGGTLSGGFELFPGRLVQIPPQVCGAVSAKPLKALGAGPPLSELTLAHCAPQKVTELPMAALRSPITKEPLPRKAKSLIFATKASWPPPGVVWKAPGVVGKLVENVCPVT